MRILLVNPPTAINGKTVKEPPYGHMPLGIAYIAALLKKHGYAVKIIDMVNYGWDKVEDTLRLEEADILGISTITGKHFSANKLAGIAKSLRKETKVIFGGHHATLMYEQVLTNYPVDFVVMGEGEVTFLELINAIEKGMDFSEIEGIAFRRDNEIIKTNPRKLIEDLDSLPFPALHLYDFDSYRTVKMYDAYSSFTGRRLKLSFRRQAPIVSSRGCAFKCQFCSSSQFWGYRWRFRSAKNVAEELQYLNQTFGIDFFNFCDDAWTLSEKRVEELCAEILKRKLAIYWDTMGRVHPLTKNMLDLMREAGCIRLRLGVESGSSRVLKTIKKQITPGQSINAFKLSREAKIPADALLMVGNPGDDIDSIEDTLSVLKLGKPFNICADITTVFPGTELYELAKSKNLLDDNYWLKNASAPYYTAEKNIFELIYLFDRLRFKFYWNKSDMINALRYLPAWIRSMIYKKTNCSITKNGIVFSKNHLTQKERVYPAQEDRVTFLEHLQRYEFLWQFVEDKTVLDVGCGAGYGTHLIAKNARRAIGVDNSREAISFAKDNYKQVNLEFLEMDANGIAFKEESFDIVSCFEVIEHLKERGIFFEAVKKALKPEGLFILSTPNRAFWSGLNGFRNKFHLKEFTPDELKGLLGRDFHIQAVYGQHNLKFGKIKKYIDLINLVNRIDFIGLRFLFKKKLRKKIVKSLMDLKNGALPESFSKSDIAIREDSLRNCQYLIFVCKK